MNERPRIPPLLKRILKIIAIVAVVVLALFGTASWVIVKNKNAWLMDQLLTNVNQAQSGELEIGSLELKLFRNFPDVTIELDSINYYERKDSVRAPTDVPILHVDGLYIALGFMPLVRGELKISEISLSTGQLTIVEHGDGTSNLMLALAKPVKPRPPKKATDTPSPLQPKQRRQPPAKPKVVQPKQKPVALQIELDAIQLEELSVTWIRPHPSKPYRAMVRKLEALFEQEGKTLAIELASEYHVEAWRINRASVPASDLTVNAALVYDMEAQHLSISESEIVYDVFSASIQGTYAHRDRRSLDMQVDASSNDIALLSRVIKSNVLRENPNLLKQGDIYLKGRIFGDLEKGRPQFAIDFGVKNMTLRLPKKLGSFSQVGFEGKLVSGTTPDYSTAQLSLSNLSGVLPGGYVKGQFHLRNFAAPYVKYKLDAQLNLDGYDQVFHMRFLQALAGTIRVNARFDGPLNLIGTHAMDSSRSSMIRLDNISFLLARSGQPIKGLTGTIEHRNNQLNVRGMSFTYGRNDFQIEATIDNFLHYLINQESTLVASGSLRSKQLFTNDLLLDSLGSAAVQDRASDLSFDFGISLPAADKELQGFDFDVRKLNARFDQLPDIQQLDARGSFGKTAMGTLLDLKTMKATLPQGRVQATGNLLVPERQRMAFTVQLKLDQFPWTYVQELADEIKSDVEPSRKTLAPSQMPRITTELDLTAAIISYPFDINNITIRNSPIRFDLPDGKSFSVATLSASISELTFLHPPNSGALTGVKSMAGSLRFNQLKLPGVNEFDIALDITGKNDQFTMGFSSATQQARREDGELNLDLTKEIPRYQLHYVVKDARLESFIEKYHKGKFMDGTIDYVLDLQTSGRNWTAAKEQLHGDIEITGDSLNFYGVDIDNVLTKFKKSQRFNLTDLGAVVVAGPIGLVATKGSDFVALATVDIHATEHSTIKKLYAKWKLDRGLLTSTDVAFATPLNRIAIDGSVDFKRDSVPGIRVAVVDKNGCSLMDQRLYGKFSNMQHGKLNVTKTLLGSVINFVNAVVGTDCKPIYTGVVPDPGKK